jgi:arsenate reductase
MITIYHNPRCSKSREALALIEQFAGAQSLTVNVVDYQKTPLTLAQLTALHQQLGDDVRAMVRDNEEEFSTLNLANADDAALLQALSSHPKLLQRPIVVYGGRAAIGRPSERIKTLLQST